MSGKKDNIIVDAIWIGLSHFSSIIPIVTLRNISQILGPNGFGEVALALAYSAYMSILIDYGFTLYGSKQVAAIGSNNAEQNKIYWAIFNAKLFLYLIGIVIGSFIIYLSNKEGYFLLFIAIFFSAASVFYQQWHFQGLSRMRDTIIPLYFYRTLPLLISFFYINVEINKIFCIFLILIPNLMSALHCFMIRGKYGVMGYRLDYSSSKKVIRDSFVYFISSLSISFYGVYTIMVAGIYLSKDAIGIYVAAERLKFVFQSLLTPFSQAQFIYLSKMGGVTSNFIRVFLRFGLVQICSSLLLASLLWIYSDYIINILYGDDYVSAAFILKWLCGGIVLVSISNLTGVLGLVAAGDTKIYSLVLAVVGIATIPFAFFLISTYKNNGLIWAVLSSELLVAVLMTLGWKYYQRKNK